MRLQKFLSVAGVCSRRKGEDLIRQGRVSVNGAVVTQLGTKVDSEEDHIQVDGQSILTKPALTYIALNKPAGYVTTCSQADEKIVLDLVDTTERIYPVGRLDKDSTGLLLLTNDGRLHHKLSHPSFDHEKEYEVTLAEPVSDGVLKKMARGLPMMGSKTRPAVIRRLSARKFRIILQEGRNRQIRRMVRKVGHQTVHLKRIRVATIKLGKLPVGAWRYLSPREQKDLLKQSQIESSD